MSNVDILIITGAHIALWILLYRLKKGKFDPFDPYYISTGIYALIFVYGPFVWLNRGQTAYQGVEVMKYLPVATLVFNICFAVFSLFSYFTASRKQVNMSELTDQNDMYQEFLHDKSTERFIIRYGAAVFIVSLLLSLLYHWLIGRSFLFMLTLGQGDDLSQIRTGEGIYFLGQFSRCAIAGLLLLFAFSKKWRFLIYIGAYVLSAVCITSGSRNLAICVVLSLLVFHYMKMNKRPKLTTVILGIVILYLFVGFMGVFRRTIKVGGDIDLDLLNSESMFSAFMFNVEIFYPFYTLVGYISNGIMSYHWGLGILNIPLQFIPRAIWSSKPATLGLSAFEAMYGNSMGGAAYPNIGEFYYEFGLIGAIIGMAAFGFISQKIYQSSKRFIDEISVIEYSLFFGYLMQFICRGHFASWAIDIVLLFGPIWILKYVLKNRYKRWLISNSAS